MNRNLLSKDKKNNKKSGLDLGLNSNQIYLYVYKFFWLIILLVSAIALFIAYQFFLLPKYNSIVSNQEITAKRQEYSDKLDYYNQLIALKTTYEKIKPEDRDKVNQIITTVANQNELYRETEYIIKKNGLTVEGIEPLTLDKSYDLPNIAPTSKRSVLLNNMKLTMTSCNIAKVNYEALIRVLKTFELNLRIMDVTKVEYDPVQQKATIHFITYQF